MCQSGLCQFEDGAGNCIMARNPPCEEWPIEKEQQLGDHEEIDEKGTETQKGFDIQRVGR